MIRGIVSTDGVPVIILPIANQNWKATIDTGFNGDLELPDSLRNFLNAHYVGRVTSALAGGQTIEESVYLVDFPFDGEIMKAEATFVANHEILIGTHLLREYRLLVNFVSQTVELERVSILQPHCAL